MFHSFQSLPPLESSDIVDEKKDMKKLVFSVLGAVIIIAILTLFIFPLITSSLSITDSISISDITIIESSDKCEAYFTLINSGGEDVFVDIEMFVWTNYMYVEGKPLVLANPLYHVQEQFFIKGNTIAEKIMQSESVPKFYCKRALIDFEIIKN